MTGAATPIVPYPGVTVISNDPSAIMTTLSVSALRRPNWSANRPST